MTDSGITNRPIVLLAIDVEEWYQTLAYERFRQDHRDQDLESRAEEGIRWILEQLALTGNSATFFISGELAESSPGLVDLIVQAGFEIGCHGYRHRSLDTFTPEAAAAEIDQATTALAARIGRPIRGFRAPNWSVRPEMAWFFTRLRESGYRYDASIVPLTLPWFGVTITGANRTKIMDNGLIEIFPAVIPLGILRIPLGLGFVFRLVPRIFLLNLLRRAGRTDETIQLNLHAWELADRPPPLFTGPVSRILTAAGLKSVRRKLETIMSQFRVSGMGAWLDQTMPPRDGYPRTEAEAINRSETGS